MSIEPMTADELAAFFHDSGTSVVRINDVWWVESHPFFFRPLLPFTETEARRSNYPLRACLGGVQHAVANSAPANSAKRYLVFEHPQDYTMATLGCHRAKIVRKALRTFEWRPCADEEAFVAQAYPVYADFARRTGYGFKRERTDQHEFAKWAHALFRHPKVAVFGAYRSRQLAAVSVQYLVRDTCVHSMYFSDTPSQRDQVYDFVLHHLREDAAKTDARLILMGPWTGAHGVDQAKIIRGCSLVTKRTHLHINPLAALLLRFARPGIYERLLGGSSADMPTAAESLTASGSPDHPESAPVARDKEHAGQGTTGDLSGPSPIHSLRP